MTVFGIHFNIKYFGRQICSFEIVYKSTTVTNREVKKNTSPTPSRKSSKVGKKKISSETATPLAIMFVYIIKWGREKQKQIVKMQHIISHFLPLAMSFTRTFSFNSNTIK